MLLGCIGDDFTGSSDLANTLAKGGMRTIQYSGVPAGSASADVEAGVVALKSRTIPADEAVRQSLAALDWLMAQGCRQIVFKICSTFDSTERGNIGPVAEALADALGAESVVVCPAFPTAGRTVYQGHLFVGDRLLSESGMETHPLTPMRDADIRRVLTSQSRGPAGHVAHAIVRAGPDAIAAALADEARAGRRLVVVDAIHDEDLATIGRAARTARLLTGGSGVALGLPTNFADEGLLADTPPAWTGIGGPAAALAGSVSRATRGQVERHIEVGLPARALSPDEIMAGTVTADELAGWALAQTGLPLIYSSADPEAVARAQAAHGADTLAATIERLMADTARALVEAGLTRLVCAGGETSGAIVSGLAIASMRIGPEIDPGVPAMMAEGRPLALALKSGNFGGPDFFEKAAHILGGSHA